MATADDHKLKPGDILAFGGKGFLSGWINFVTLALPGWGASHVSMVGKRRSKLLNYESTSTYPDEPKNYCAIKGCHVRGMQAHTLDFALDRPGKIWVYRAKNKLTCQHSDDLTAFLDSQLGKEYDYVGAGKTFGGFIRTLIRQRLYREDLSTLWCSEIVAAAVNLLWRLKHYGTVWTGNPSAWSPNSLLRALVSDGLYEPAERLK